jgi:uncharacterized protein (TIGR03435 family)
MKAILIFLLLSLRGLYSFSQGLQIKAGDFFPDLPISNLINAPVTSIILSKPPEKKLYILSFWGTWCAPCIPEMDALAKLQVRNSSNIQVIGIANDSHERLVSYLKKKPSTIWLASDTSALFYQMFLLTSVGHSAIINAAGKVVAVVKTDSLNQQMISRLLAGQNVKSTADLKFSNHGTKSDLFGVDSTLSENFTLRGYMKGKKSMSMSYGRASIYGDRRITFVNCSAVSLYKEAYQINSSKQIVYEFPEKEVSDYENKETLYCLDIMVKFPGIDSLYNKLRERLSEFLPVKARIEMREIPVYAVINRGFNQPQSVETVPSYSFSGNGYDGKGTTIANFADNYLSNEFDLPVVDETGLPDRYNIKTQVELRTRESILKSIGDIGLELVKKTKSMRVLILSKQD